jgi:hypothetical protein
MIHNASGLFIKHVKCIENSKRKVISITIIVRIFAITIKFRAENKIHRTAIKLLQSRETQERNIPRDTASDQREASGRQVCKTFKWLTNH